MVYYFVFSGLLLVVLGWLLYRNPNWINPYGDMLPEMKARVDIDGLKRSLFICLGICGGVIILAVLLNQFHIVGPSVPHIVMCVDTLFLVVWAIIAMRKYNGFGRDENGVGYYSLYMNKAAKITVVIVMVMVVAVVVVLSIIMSNR